MLKKWRNINLHLISFFVIIAIASVLRLGGIYPSYPPYHSDEGMSYAQGIAIVRENTIDAHGYSLALGYPSLVPIISAVIFKTIFIPMAWSKFDITNLGKFSDGIIHLPLSIDDYKRIFQLDILGNREIYVLAWGRVVVAFFGIGITVLVYFLSRQILDKKTAIFSSLLVAVNYRQVLNSHINLPDIYSAFFLILSLIFSYRIITKTRRVDYMMAGIFVGLSIATKFHIYPAVAFVTSYLIFVFKNKIRLINVLFNRNFFIAVFVGILVFLLINPYHFIHFEDAVDVIRYESLKYGAGRFAINPFPFWYLFNFGVGRFTLLFSLLGVVLMFFKRRATFVFLFITLFSFFYFITYATNGGYYTRNFVTITPILLIFPGYLLSLLITQQGKFKSIKLLFLILILPLLFLENFSKAIVVPLQYSKEWNYEVVGKWLSENIPDGSKISAHSSVPLPDYTVTRLTYDEANSYSLQEFVNDKADFSVTNLDWVTNGYYGWMNSYNVTYWNKPIAEMEGYYSSMSTEELSDYSIYSVIKPALSPESDFFVSKIPKFTILESKLTESFQDNKPIKWVSKPININSYNGILIKGDIKNGYLYLNFYKELNDTNDILKRIGTRVSAREKNIKETSETIETNIPTGANWIVIGFASYLPDASWFRNLKLYDSLIKIDLGKYKVHQTKIPVDVLFPNSQGNL